VSTNSYALIRSSDCGTLADFRVGIGLNECIGDSASTEMPGVA